MSTEVRKIVRAKKPPSALEPWIVELMPIIWVFGFAFYEFNQVNVFVQFTWHWVEDLSNPGGLRLADVAATFALLMILISFLLLIPRMWRYGGLVIFSILCSVLVITDSLHANYFGVLPSIAEKVELRQLFEVTKSISDLFSPLYIVLFLDTIGMLLLWPIHNKLARRTDPLTFGHRSKLAGTIVLVGIFVLSPTIYRGQQTQALANSDRLRQFGATVGVLPYHAIDLMAYATEDTKVSEEEYGQVRAFLESRRPVAETPSPLRGVAKGSNLILISAESQMAYTIGLEINGRPVMPRFTKFVRESLYFSNFHEQAWLGNTSDADFIVMQTLYPLPMGPVATNNNQNQFFALPHILRRAGYSTMSANGAPGWMWKRDTMHKAFGIERSYFREAFTATDRVLNWIPDKEFFEQSIARLQDMPRPFMAYLLSSSNHHPFDIPDSFRTLDVGKYQGTALGSYLQASNYFDTAFGALLDGLDAAGLLEKTVIAVFADHRAYLAPERALVAEMLGHPPGSVFHRLRSRKLLPFVVRLPGGKHAGDYPTFSGQIDVAPTLLSLLDVPGTPTTWMGRDLTAEGSALVIFRDGSFTDGEVYFINRYGPIANASCFAVATGEAIDCAPMAAKRAEVQRHLNISDFIIRGDLVSRLRGDFGRAAAK